jgi:hypothetical protein
MKTLFLYVFLCTSFPLLAEFNDYYNLGFDNAKNETIYRIGRDIYNTELKIRDLEEKISCVHEHKKFMNGLNEDHLKYYSGKLEYYRRCYDLIESAEISSMKDS